MKLFGWLGGESSSALPPDRLGIAQLANGADCLQAVSGMLSTADSCTYEPTQRLLAVRAGVLFPIEIVFELQQTGGSGRGILFRALA